jgi:glycosyltransferase involved in cell wall biosynthesis
MSGRRVVMFVTNTVTHDSRVLREAVTLRDAGWDVTIVGRRTTEIPDMPERERYRGLEIIRVAQPIGWRVAWRHRMTLLRAPWRARGEMAEALRRDAGRGVRGIPGIATRIAGMIAGIPWLGYRAVDHFALGDRLPTPRRDGAVEWLLWWRRSAMGWAAAAVDAAPPADIYHGHDLTGLAAADLAGRIRGGKVVYDSHEIYLDSRSNARRPRWAKAIMAAVERRWARRADTLMSVNRAYADVLAGRFGRDGFVVVHNCPPRWTPGTPGDRPDRLRTAAGIGPSARVVLYHGLFGRERGIEQLAEAMLEPGLEMAHLALLGYGPLESELRALASEARFDGRIHVLDAVPPDDLLDWIVTADVDAIPLQPTTLNHRLCTPNKLFESITAGVPVVVSDFPVMRGIVMDDPAGPLGATCDPAEPASIAMAIRSILDQTDVERATLRARCAEAAAERWNWETESKALLAAYEGMAPPAAS